MGLFTILFQIRGVCRFSHPVQVVWKDMLRYTRVEENRLFIQDIDVFDETPLLDIKPYVPEFDSYPLSKAGWLEKNRKMLSGHVQICVFMNRVTLMPIACPVT